MKPKQKTRTKKREQKNISLVMPEKVERQAEDVDQIPTEPEAASVGPAEPTTVEAKTKKPPAQLPARKTDHKRIAREIADELGETATWPRYQIRHLIWALGVKQARALARKAKEIEDAGGMMLPSGARRRTLGGVFFHLVYSEGQALPGRSLKRPDWKPKPRPEAPIVTTESE